MSGSSAYAISVEVQEAMNSGAPIVALESALVACGLPWPDNMQAAELMVETIRGEGAVPAAIGVIAGRPTIGLDHDELMMLATAPGVMKVSRRDLPIAMARRAHGGTTVAGTLAVMAQVGLNVLATGGMGGVHRGIEQTLDISADLAELARSSATVICSGAKSLLDLPRTVELLETLGISTVGFQTDKFPAFYVRETALPVDSRADTVEQVAEIVRARRTLRLAGATVILAPIPEDAAMTSDDFEQLLEESAQHGPIPHGRDVTPETLTRLHDASRGRTVSANLALLENNARLASKISRALADQ